MRTTFLIDLNEAEKLISTAFDKATAMGVQVHAAVTDASGLLVAYKKMDGANAVSGQIARAKAFTSATTGAATTALAPKTLPGEPGWGLNHMAHGQVTSLGGGVPVLHKGIVIGGIGISGASVAQDIEIAEGSVQG